MKKLKATAIVWSVLAAVIFSQNPQTVDFLGIASKEIDSSMLQMTENLYLTQLREIQGVVIFDRRNEKFKTTFNETDEIDLSDVKSTRAFYATIKTEGENLNCILSIVDMPENRTRQISKTYDSYYKILTESKASLKSIFTDLLDIKPNLAASKEPPQSSTENIAGTWRGEEHIDKIVILRGGRGFIIYKNGATMNITVVSKGNSITVTQAGKSNASFFPELPRQLALQEAVDAKPIFWNLFLQNDNTLKGSKTTLLPSENGATLGTVSVQWTRK